MLLSNININKRYKKSSLDENNSLKCEKVILSESLLQSNNQLPESIDQRSLIVYVINITLSESNILISITDKNGNLLDYCTSGELGFLGSQKTKKYTLITMLKKFLYNYNYINNKSVLINFKGISKNQKLIIKKLKEKVSIKMIRYNNLLPHNGCRPKKKRRK